jgi:hypothetical protein
MRLTETYMALGIVNEAQTAAAVLGHNFPDSPWYKDAYRIVRGRRRGRASRRTRAPGSARRSRRSGLRLILAVIPGRAEGAETRKSITRPIRIWLCCFKKRHVSWLWIPGSRADARAPE